MERHAVKYLRALTQAVICTMGSFALTERALSVSSPLVTIIVGPFLPLCFCLHMTNG